MPDDAALVFTALAPYKAAAGLMGMSSIWHKPQTIHTAWRNSSLQLSANEDIGMSGYLDQHGSTIFCKCKEVRTLQDEYP